MLMIVQDVDGGVIDVLSVKNFDGDFSGRLKQAEYDWADSTEDFDSFVYGKLRSYGYEFDVLSRHSDWDVCGTDF